MKSVHNLTLIGQSMDQSRNQVPSTYNRLAAMDFQHTVSCLAVNTDRLLFVHLLTVSSTCITVYLFHPSMTFIRVKYFNVVTHLTYLYFISSTALVFYVVNLTLSSQSAFSFPMRLLGSGIHWNVILQFSFQVGMSGWSRCGISTVYFMRLSHQRTLHMS